MNPSKEQLIDALYNEYQYLIHDDFNPEEDATPEEYLEMLQSMTREELIEETQTDAEYTLDEFIHAYS